MDILTGKKVIKNAFDLDFFSFIFIIDNTCLSDEIQV